MRHSHKELVREEMKKGNKYCKDLCNLSISEITSTIEFCNKKILESGVGRDYAPNIQYVSIVNEFTEYMNEFTLRISNRTANFAAQEFKEI